MGENPKTDCDLRSYGFFTTKTETEDQKKDHLPWTTACPRAPRDEKNRGEKTTKCTDPSVRMNIRNLHILV